MTDLNRALAEALEPVPEDVLRIDWPVVRKSGDRVSPGGLWLWGKFNIHHTPLDFDRDGNAMLALMAALPSKGWYVYCEPHASREKDGRVYGFVQIERYDARDGDDKYVANFYSTKEMPRAVSEATAKALGLKE